MRIKHQNSSPKHQLSIMGNKKQVFDLKRMVKSRFQPKIIYSRDCEESRILESPYKSDFYNNNTEVVSLPSFMDSHSNLNSSVKPFVLRPKEVLIKKISSHKVEKVKNEIQKSKENTQTIKRASKNYHLKIRPNNLILNNWFKSSMEASTNLDSSVPRTTFSRSFVQ